MVNKRRRKSSQLRQYFDKDSDIIIEITKTMKELQFTNSSVSIRHVKGHQDNNTRYENLPLEAQLNVDADRMATRQFTRRPGQTSEFVLDSLQACLYIQGKHVPSNHSKVIRDAYHSQGIIKYLKTANNWSQSTFNSIWWSVHGKAIHKLTMGQKTTIQKYLHNRLPSNYRENLYYPYLTKYCKCCENETETQEHILICTSCEKRNKLRTTYILNLKNYLQSTFTNEVMIRVIIHYVSQWLVGQQGATLIEIAPDATYKIRQAVEAQHTIGWGHFLKGRIASKWKELYAEASRSVRNHPTRLPSPDLWGTQIIYLTFNFVLDIWYSRNEVEHTKDNENIALVKERLIRKMMWTKGTMTVEELRHYRNVQREELETSPMNNLHMLAQQLMVMKGREEIGIIIVSGRMPQSPGKKNRGKKTKKTEINRICHISIMK
jgi:hypothetical protein